MALETDSCRRGQPQAAQCMPSAHKQRPSVQTASSLERGTELTQLGYFPLTLTTYGLVPRN